jgi:anaerobic magnesium-protoporphyrin IX monomethyl ester cyclase
MMPRTAGPMAEPAKVAIVFPYFRTRSASEILFPPLGAANLAAQLRKLDLRVQIIDCTFLTWPQAQKKLRTFRPDIVGIYSMITQTRNAFRLARMVRADLPHSLLVAGGPMPTLYPDRFAAEFDTVFRGESDLSFPHFCRDASRLGDARSALGELPLSTYPGLYIHGNNLAVDNSPVHYSEREIAGFPLPDRGDFDHKIYQREWLQYDGTKTTSILTTLGCPFQCDFCSKPIFGHVFRRRNLDSVFEEIRQIRSFGYDTLWIADDNFTLDPAFLDRFCERIAPLKIAWSCLSRSTGIDRAIVRRMRAAGCRRVYLGLESGNSETLQRMNKQSTLEEGARAVNEFHAAGVEVAAFFIVGYPGETVSTVEDTFRFALSLPLDEISFNVPFPLPGSKLFDRVSGVDGTKDWRKENDVIFVYHSEFDPRWLRRRINQTIKKFKADRNSTSPVARPPRRKASTSS